MTTDSTVNKEILRKELGDLIWRMATNLVHGGKVSSVQFMDYTLGALFYRFISEDITDYCNRLMREAGVPDADYQHMSDAMAENARQQIVQAKGFFILPSQLFLNVANGAKDNDQLNTTLANNFRQIEESAVGTPSEDDVRGLFQNFNTNDAGLGSTVAERNELLTTLLESVRDLPFSKYMESGLDVFGICYEHLIKMYALNSGTKGGEFYTPAEVSLLLAQLAAAQRTTVNKVYDPACGSGSLLLNFNLVLGAKNVREGFFGQEINLKTYNLCRMNMFLHNVNYDHFDIQLGDTLLDPKHDMEEPFDAIVSNPPYSVPWPGDSDATLINDPRFSPAGVLAPKSKADFAFTMHILSWLSAEGTAAIVEFPGILYRGGAEQKIRKYLVQNNYVDTIIQLPSNLFFGATIATCIIVLKKNKADNRVCFIDASQEFIHEGNKNKLSAANLTRIYEAHVSKADIAHFCHVVTNSDIEAEDFNLSVSTYVEQEDTREAVDITELNQHISEIVSRQAELRTQLDAIIKELEEEEA
jgi:type I restriction enzyme M protein